MRIKFGALSAIVGLCLVLNACVGGLLVGGATAVGLAMHDRRTVGTVVEDQALEFRLHHALRRSAMPLGNSHINVYSYNGNVLLSGEVSSEALKRGVEDVVRRDDKVRHIHNELQVGEPSPIISRSNDAWITTKTKSSLLQLSELPHFDPTRVTVVTERGTVYLLGLVTRQEGDAVAQVARRVNGVQQVVKLFEYI